MKVTYMQSYLPQSNGPCDRKNGKYREDIRFLMHKKRCKNWPTPTDYATFVMKNANRKKIGHSLLNVFFGRRM